MARNIILAISSLAVLLVLFFAYTTYMGASTDAPVREQAERRLPAQTPSTQAVSVADVGEIPPGGKIMYKLYDERTGRPTDMFLCHDWKPVPDAKNEIHVTGPELELLLPSGMIAHISAEEGQINVDRIDQSEMRPKQGWLAGDVQIVIDRETALERTDWQSRPADLIRFSLSRLTFDLERGELKTAERITLDSADFSLAGIGLHLIWNQAENRVDKLAIAQGEQLVLYGQADLFDMPDANPTTASEGDGAHSQPAKKDVIVRRKRRPRPPTTYLCTLTGDLIAEQYQGDQRVGGLKAQALQLLFDVGGEANRLFDQQPTATRPTTQATTSPAPEQRERLVLRWSGPLDLAPVLNAPMPDSPRRQIIATGNPVILQRAEGEVRCGEVAYHDQEQRVWLRPTSEGIVTFGLGQDMHARAESVYIDRAARIIKLIGSVELRSQRDGQPTAIIRAGVWAELHLAADGAARTVPADQAFGEAGQLESAIFVGDVEVVMEQQTLTAHRMEFRFRPQVGGEGLEDLLDTAHASGDVALTGDDGRLTCAALDMQFDHTAEGEVYPRQVDAVGAAQIVRGRARIAGDRVEATIAPPAKTRSKAKAARSLVLRAVHITGSAELIDPDNKVGARGDRIAAWFSPENELTTAAVTGPPDEFGIVHATPYTVRGHHIAINREAETLQIEGPSRLSFTAERSLQGRRHDEARPVVVTATKRLNIDGRGNQARFSGDVVAASGDERLKCDTLTLIMEDVEVSVPAATTRPTFSAWWQAAQAWARQVWPQHGTAAPPALADLSGTARVRKEPTRLVADNALLESETRAPDGEQPLVHASISAPLLEVDIATRQIFTTGLTQLLLTDRRGGEDTEAAEDVLGLPTALVSEGPSQTAAQCTKRLTYTLGSDTDDRRDTAVFEENVVFVHRTGSEMVNLEQMLPEAAADPTVLEELVDRTATLECERLECWFAVKDASAGRQPQPSAGGMPVRLASLLASGSVWLRDQTESRIREVSAERIEFNREQGLIYVWGDALADARVYFSDTASGSFGVHASRHVLIDLQNRTIRGEAITGQMSEQ